MSRDSQELICASAFVRWTASARLAQWDCDHVVVFDSLGAVTKVTLSGIMVLVDDSTFLPLRVDLRKSTWQWEELVNTRVGQILYCSCQRGKATQGAEWHEVREHP